MGNNYKIGRWGESRALDYLKGLRYRILYTNYRCYLGEIDIIGTHEEYLVFIEVKTRRDEFFPGLEAIDNKKQKQIIKIAEYFINQKGYHDSYVRFDALSIDQGKITLIKNAFMSYN